MKLLLHLILLMLGGSSMLLLGRADAFVAPRLLGSSSAPTTSTATTAITTAGVVLLRAVSQESSSAKFSGAGAPLVDMNRYNLPSLDEMAAEWTAVAVPATPLQEAGVYLRARNAREIMADTVQVRFPRNIGGGGLGLQLLELAGGRDDGLGIVIVQDVVKGGAAEGSGLLPGDSIIKVEVQRISSSSSGTSTADDDSTPLQTIENSESCSVDTECLGYDKTVEALQSLPPPVEDTSTSEILVVTVKRLRRKPKVQVTLQYPPSMNEPDVSLELFAGENLRRALLVRGTKLNDPLAARFDSGGTGDCGAEGTCATCAVAVLQGMDLLGPPGQQEAQIFRMKPRWRMTCRTVVGYGMREGELKVRLSPRQWGDEKQ